ncbi:hypothetical protein [uncultured Sphingomonas sp.]|uniref:hypothetical protein n=1 Tax=uncultured Sphingomonas sp. TaxID=158754 RepID=UPI0035CB978D
MATTITTSHAGADAAGKIDCWHADEVAAARVGTLQTLLMVQALKCQETSPTTLAAYNKFMADKHDVIVRDRYLIQAHFVRQYGAGDGLKASDDYQTRLGNQNSSALVTVGECEKAGTYSRLAAAASEDDLAVLANMTAATTSITQCPEPAAAVAAPAAMVIPVWRRPNIAATPPAPLPVKAEPAVATIVPGEHSPEVLAAISAPVHDPVAVPVATKAVPVAPPPPSNADTMKALQAAVAALTQVAATLQPAVAVASPAVVRTEE